MGSATARRREVVKVRQFGVSVEVLLDAPVSMDDDLPPAIGYFRRYEVAASSPEEAKSFVTEEIEADGGGVVRFEKVKKIRRRSSSSMPGVTWRSGRVYVPEETTEGA
jgi:hypothetical protein